MARLRDTWTVEPHGELVSLDDGLLTVEGEIAMPLGRFPRRMTIARLASGGTAIWSAIPLQESAMRRIEELGTPSWLIIPGAGHRLDARAWKARYPNLRVLCAPGARAKVEEAVKVDATADPFGDPRVAFEVVPGTGAREGVLHVRRDAGETLVVNDLVANVRHPHGLGAHVMARVFGFGVKKPAVPRIGRRLLVDDPRALAAAFRRWANERDIRRLIPSHGDVLEAPHDTLLRLADALAPRVAA